MLYSKRRAYGAGISDWPLSHNHLFVGNKKAVYAKVGKSRVESRRVRSENLVRNVGWGILNRRLHSRKSGDLVHSHHTRQTFSLRRFADL